MPSDDSTNNIKAKFALYETKMHSSLTHHPIICSIVLLKQNLQSYFRILTRNKVIAIYSKHYMTITNWPPHDCTDHQGAVPR